jgi:hypothetical protein
MWASRPRPPDRVRPRPGRSRPCASPSPYSRQSEAQVLDGVVRATPALSDGRLYLRNESELVCVKLK